MTLKLKKEDENKQREAIREMMLKKIREKKEASKQHIVFNLEQLRSIKNPRELIKDDKDLENMEDLLGLEAESMKRTLKDGY